MGVTNTKTRNAQHHFSKDLAMQKGVGECAAGRADAKALRLSKWGIGKGKGNGSRIGKSLSKISTHFLRAGMCERGKVARKMYF